ncbi:Tetratricopeptide repeat protein [anaerobic digester metagenome]
MSSADTMPAMQGSLRYLVRALFAAMLALSGTAAGAIITDEIASEADVRAFHSIDNASLAVYAGQTALQAGRFDEAVEHFSEAVEADPSWMAAWYLKAYSLARLNRTDEALAAVDRALVIEPKDRDSNDLKADLLESLGRETEAAHFRSVAAAASAALQTTTPTTTAPTTRASAHPIMGLSAVMVALLLWRVREV